MNAMLASVRDVNEARLALAGGCEWLDIKEPDAGALGRASATVVCAIVSLTANRVPVSATIDADLFGPTCDSADHMRGPFPVPACVREGDWLEIGQLGAYGAALRTAFNGFDRARLVDVSDGPMLATPGYDAS